MVKGQDGRSEEEQAIIESSWIDAGIVRTRLESQPTPPPDPKEPRVLRAWRDDGFEVHPLV